MTVNRPVNCEACGRLFWTTDTPPYCCDGCSDAAYEGEMAELEAQARAQGFESFEAWAEHEQRHQEPPA